MDFKQLESAPHRRLNPLTGDWVLVSPERSERPWQGRVEAKPQPAPAYDPSCYLCPGNLRDRGRRNPAYSSTFVFDNDFAALAPDAPAAAVSRQGLIRAESESGICRVVCFSPRHDLALARMTAGRIRDVVDLWCEQFRELAGRSEIRYVQIFENRGEMMGASNPHPHGQIWANRTIPNELRKETRRQRDFFRQRRACLLCRYRRLEEDLDRRIVCANDGFLALVPFWAAWPFETLVLPRRHAPDLLALEDRERDQLASILKRLTTRYDNLFRCPFPYSMGFHQQPAGGRRRPEWHLHAHFYPPLLRSATIRKFMVGYEMLCAPQRDLTPEAAAKLLRSIGERHDAAGRDS